MCILRAQAVACERYWVVDAGSGTVMRYASTSQAYTEAHYRALLEACGFQQVTFWPSFGEAESPAPLDYLTITAQR